MAKNLHPDYTSQEVNLSNITKPHRRILGKILPNSRGDPMQILENSHNTFKETKWGIGKKPIGFAKKNWWLVPWIPAKLSTYLDIGCGDGMDANSLQKLRPGVVSICADIQDNRDPRYKSGDMLVLEVGKKMELQNESVDMVTMMHSIHHSEDAAFRLHDVARVIKTGGILAIKDHNVTSNKIASNVDFEHFVYIALMVGSPLQELAKSYSDPMFYYSAQTLSDYICSLGFERLYIKYIGNITQVYMAIFRKLTTNTDN